MINYLIPFSAFAIGIPFLKLQKFFLLLGINFISENFVGSIYKARYK
jgi:hypothetical protein